MGVSYDAEVHLRNMQYSQYIGDRITDSLIKVVTMKEIERRLRYTGDSIKQISQAMNFPNTSFFGKYFKQHSGMTPNNYRKKYHK